MSKLKIYHLVIIEKKLTLKQKTLEICPRAQKNISHYFAKKITTCKICFKLKMQWKISFLFSASEIVLLALLRVDFNEFNPFFQ